MKGCLLVLQGVTDRHNNTRTGSFLGGFLAQVVCKSSHLVQNNYMLIYTST